MRRLAHLARALLLTGPVLLSACGGQTKDSTTFSSGLPPEQSLSDLNQGDKGRVCSSLVGYLQDNKDLLCKITGYLSASLDTSFGIAMADADVQSKCAESLAKCESDQPFATPSACKPLDISSDCSATVREYESCLTEELTQIRDYASGLPTCSQLTAASFDAQATTHTDKVVIGRGPACKALQARCPEQFDEGAIGGSSSSSGSSTDVGSSPTTPLPDAGSFPVRCGNGVIDPGEDCDSINLNGQTCVSVTMGTHPAGTLHCQSTCQFDMSGCI
jgi:hypothetical protein